MESFAIPAAGGIIEQKRNGRICVLLQERWKDEAPTESGLFEIPAGKIRAFENIYACLRREIYEETGLTVTKIQVEAEAVRNELNGYQVINYTPFACAQNLQGNYPIMVQIFLCEVQGTMRERSNESQNLQWITLPELQSKLTLQPDKFYPMHFQTLQRYVMYRTNNEYLL